MRNRLPWFLACVVLGTLLPAAPVPARGGGGCLEIGTPVLTPSGAVPVEELKPGDTVLGLDGGAARPVTVRDVLQVRAVAIVEITAGRHMIRATPEHPVGVSPGVFRMASLFKRGDTVLIVVGGRVRTGTVTSVRQLRTGTGAYNLLVGKGGTYLADGIVVHNKGCFLPDTRIRREDGSEVPVSRVRPGDRLLAFTDGGTVVTATVRSVMTHDVDEYRVVTTEKMVLQVTPEHPFSVGNGTFKTLDALRPGDAIHAFDGSAWNEQRIISIEAVHAPTTVYNLRTDAPHTYFANGIAVHNKGGGGGGFRSGGGRSSSRGGSGGGTGENVFVAIWVAGFVVWVVVTIVSKKSRRENLDQLFSRKEIEQKSSKTLKLVQFIAKQDPAFNEKQLEEIARATFVKLQECWQSRQYDDMKPLLMPDLFADHLRQIEGMRRNHEINMIDGLRVDAVDLVNIRYPLNPQEREFTALITATAKDYYVDDRAYQRIRGDDEPAQFQEFWTFQYRSGSWLLREIEQTAESDILKDDNYFEPFTDKAVDQVYGEAAGPEGPTGPWTEGETLAKEQRIERLLNHLVLTDKLWARNRMLQTARSTFIAVTGAWESGTIAAGLGEKLFPELARDLTEAIDRNTKAGIALEFRNLAVRKAELVLVKNFADNRNDEFVVRIRAHAQKVMRRGGVAVRQDADVTAFEEYLTFGRLDNEWKLKEIVAPESGKDLVALENVDEGSSPQMVEWYYQHKRPL